MTAPATADTDLLLDALALRCRAVCGAMGISDAEVTAWDIGGPEFRAARMVSGVMEHVRRDPLDERVWLLYVALYATFPYVEQVQSMRRLLARVDSGHVFEALLEWDGAPDPLAVARPLELVTDRVLACVDFCAKLGLSTGIQRVVRQAMARWPEGKLPTMVAWTQGDRAFRALHADEEDMVLRFESSSAVETADTGLEPVLVPWRTTLFLPEVPMAHESERLRALARFTPNRLVALGYDCIPVVSADMVSDSEPFKFTAYLGLLRYVDEVIAISNTAAEEFEGFADMVSAQGVPGPRSRACLLPSEVPVVPAGAGAPREWSNEPTVLVVGTHDPRKNHLAVLHAAELLWREGLVFRLRFIGGRGLADDFDERVEELQAAGRSIAVERGSDDATIWEAYRSARFSVFPSLHEGYGLPVAESLAVNTPVITTNYGSTAEILAHGGGLAVDPRDDHDLTDAMRKLLTDDALLTRLRAEAASRPPRTWRDYAADIAAMLEGDR